MRQILMRQPHAWPRGEGDGALDVRKDRGFPKITREYFEHEVEYGSLYVGSPETVAGCIVRAVITLGADRFDLKYGMGPMPHAALMDDLRPFGTEVARSVREQLQKR
jgi:hypothetical protein